MMSSTTASVDDQNLLVFSSFFKQLNFQMRDNDLDLVLVKFPLLANSHDQVGGRYKVDQGDTKDVNNNKYIHDNTTAASPATRTLDLLSQPTGDLFYNPETMNDIRNRKLAGAESASDESRCAADTGGPVKSSRNASSKEPHSGDTIKSKDPESVEGTEETLGTTARSIASPFRLSFEPTTERKQDDNVRYNPSLKTESIKSSNEPTSSTHHLIAKMLENNQGFMKKVAAVGHIGVYYVSICQPGHLGLVIRSSSIPQEIQDALLHFGLQAPGNEFETGCLVEEVKTSGIASSTGISAEDYLLYLEPETKELHSEYGEVRKAAVEGRRPLNLCVVRRDRMKKGAKVVCSTDALQANALQHSPNDGIDAIRQGGATSTKSNEVVPFCLLCNGKAPRPVHHAWCPKHPQFKASGADEVLQRIQEGVQLGCSACRRALQEGRMETAELHSNACISNQNRRLSDNNVTITDKTSTNKPKSLLPRGSSGSKQNRFEHNAGPQTTTRPEQHVQFSERSRNLEGTLSEKGLHERDLPKGRGGESGPRKTLGKTKESNKKTSSSTSKDHYGNKNPNHSVPTGATAPRMESAKAMKPKRKASKDPNPSKRIPKNKIRRSQGRKQLAQDDPQQVPQFSDAVRDQPTAGTEGLMGWIDEREQGGTSTSKIEFIWEDCENPWGPTGYVEGDVEIFSSARGIVNVETVLPDQRFLLDPFSTYSRYSLSHHTPHEGFQALVLKRDAFAKIAWGFTIRHHEAGGACLVASVSHNSPADAATLLGGAGSDYAQSLRVHDMIIAAGGKPTAGMTVTALEVELEIAGPELLLLVSRYKFAAQLKGQIELAEANYLRALDDALNDDCRLDWIDIGEDHAVPQNDDPNMSSEDHVMASQLIDNIITDGTWAHEGMHSNEMVEAMETIKELQPNQSLSIHLSAERNLLKEVRQAERQNTQSQVHKTNSSHSRLPDEPEPASKFFSSQIVNARKQKRENDNDSPNDSLETEEEWEDDGNAWSNCVCGRKHEKTVSVFWIQCDCCRTWYNVSSICVGFVRREAVRLKYWNCWGCPSPTNPTAVATTSAQSNSFDSDESRAEELDKDQKTNLTCRKTPTVRNGDNRLTSDGCIRPLYDAPKNPDGTFSRPSGKPPKGYIWDMIRGLWSPVPPFQEPVVSSRSRQDSNVRGAATSAVESETSLFEESNREESEISSRSTNIQASTTNKKPIILNCDSRMMTDGCIRPLYEAPKNPDGTFARPRGKPPKGFIWDATRGFWSRLIRSNQESQTSQVPSTGRSVQLQTKAKANAVPEEETIREMFAKGDATGVATTLIASKISALEESSSDECDSSSRCATDRTNKKSKVLNEVDRLTPDGCVRPLQGAAKNPDGSFERPGGNPPKGDIWDTKRGLGTPSVHSNRKSETQIAPATHRTSHSSSNASAHFQTTSNVKAATDDEKQHSEVFEKNDIVWITEHGWPGVNNPAGVARVLQSYIDEDGDRLYDVKYIVGVTHRGILARFVGKHEF